MKRRSSRVTTTVGLRTCWPTTKMMMSFSEKTKQHPVVEMSYHYGKTAECKEAQAELQRHISWPVLFIVPPLHV